MWTVTRRRKAIDPGKPHPFMLPDDGALGALASSGRGDEGSFGFTSAYLRKDDRCAVPGCGRGRDDDLHAAAS